jgi:hypothetical protein
VKYLKSIFESTNTKEQYEIIEDFFLNFLEEQDDEAPIYSEMDDADGDETYCIFRTHYNWYSKSDTLEDWNYYLECQNKRVEHLKGINTALKRLTGLGYNWDFEEYEGGFGISIYYKKDGDETLDSALEPLSKGGKALHESILKMVLQKKYGLSLKSTNYTAGTSGYYGRNPNFMLWFPKDTFDYEHPFYKDFEKWRQTHRGIVNSVEVRPSGDGIGTIFKIELQG